jgi:hypothetical protein
MPISRGSFSKGFIGRLVKKIFLVRKEERDRLFQLGG